MLSTVASYNLIARDIERSLETTAKKPMVAREAEYYRDNIEKIKSIDDFLADRRIFGFAMKAFGLEDMTYAKAFMRKALSEGTSGEDAFVNKLSDKRYKEFVDTFNFTLLGETTTTFASVKQGVIDKYIRQTLEEDAGASNEGVRLALYFERKAATITDVYELLGDKALLQVTQTALGISPTTALADIDTQAKMISGKLDIEDLKDPEKLGDLLTRFTTMWEMNNGSAGSASPALLLGQPLEVGISTNVLMSLQSLRLGGR